MNNVLSTAWTALVVAAMATTAFACTEETAADADSGADTNTSASTIPGPGYWVDRTYVVTVPATNWSKPKGIGSDVGAFVPRFAFTITGSTETQVDLLVGTAIDTAQDTCTPTSSFTGSSETYPAVRIGPQDFRARVVNDIDAENPIVVYATLYDLEFVDILPTDVAPAEDGVLRGVIDTRELYSLFSQLPDPTPDTVCAASAAFEAPCTACRDGEPYCIELEAIGIGATETGLDGISPIAESDLDPSCLRD